MADMRQGIYGRNGFIPYPGVSECGVPFEAWAQRISAAEAKDALGGEPESTRAHPTHADSLRDYQQEQQRRAAARNSYSPLESYPEYAQRITRGYAEPLVPSVYAEAGRDARIRRENGGHIQMVPTVGIASGGIVPPRESEAARQALKEQEDFTAYAADRYGKGQRMVEALGGGIAQMAHAPGKMFSRETMLAVIAVERTKWFNDGTEAGGLRYRAAMQVMDEMQRVVERM